jgi:hypothetical protein
MNNNYMMYVWSKSFEVPAETFFLLIFKDGPLENFDGFLKIAISFICLNTSGSVGKVFLRAKFER